MEAVREKQKFEEKKREVSDRIMAKKLSKPIQVIVRGRERTMSMLSYFTCRKDHKLDLKLPGGQAPLVDPREKQVEKENKSL